MNVSTPFLTIEQARAHYLHQLNSALLSLSSQGRNVDTELCLALNRPDAGNDLYRLYVADIVELVDGEAKLIDINVAPSSVRVLGLPVDAPIAWNGIEFRCSSEHFPEDALVSWGRRWISDESPPLGPQDKLAGIIHAVGEPERCHSHVEFNVDFGSAPVMAFHELIALLGEHLQSLGSYSLVSSDG